MTDVVTRVAELAAADGLLLRGGFHPEAGDGVPPLDSGEPARTVLMLGNAGPGLWQHFSTSREFGTAGSPLDRWSRRVITAIAAAVGAAPLFPFGGPPHLPFQRWARRAEPVHVSPLRLLIHPVYGLWHAYRGALVFPASHAVPEPRRDASPCDGCAMRPCLSACPVGAFTAESYAVDRCLDHLREPSGAECGEGGCLARRACPIGSDYRYAPAQASFHLDAFIARRRG